MKRILSTYGYRAQSYDPAAKHPSAPAEEATVDVEHDVLILPPEPVMPEFWVFDLRRRMAGAAGGHRGVSGGAAATEALRRAIELDDTVDFDAWFALELDEPAPVPDAPRNHAGRWAGATLGLVALVAAVYRLGLG